MYAYIVYIYICMYYMLYCNDTTAMRYCIGCCIGVIL